MLIHLNRGATHAVSASKTTSRHIMRSRVGPGRGDESFFDEIPSPVAWVAGAVEYLPPGVRHDHATLVETDWISLEFDDMEWSMLTGNKKHTPNLIRCTDGHRLSSSYTLAQTLYQLLDVDKEVNPLQFEVFGVHLANQIHEALFRPDTKLSSQKSLTDATLGKIQEFVEDQLHLPLRLSGLAELAHLSKFHFTSVFRESTGLTPYQYVRDRRIVKAKQLLQQSANSITNIALDCGFSSHSHLTTAFKKRVGVTPTGYRRHHRKKFTVAISPRLLKSTIAFNQASD